MFVGNSDYQVDSILVPGNTTLDIQQRTYGPPFKLKFVFPGGSTKSDVSHGLNFTDRDISSALKAVAHELYHVEFALDTGPQKAVSNQYITANESGAVCAEWIMDSSLAPLHGYPLTIRSPSDGSLQRLSATLGDSEVARASVRVREDINRLLIDGIAEKHPGLLAGPNSAVISSEHEKGLKIVETICLEVINESRRFGS